MFYISKYNFEVNQNISVLNDQMKKSIVGVHDFESENIFGISTPYFGQFNYDEFMLSKSAKPFERIGITPDAHIKLQKLDDEKTLVSVKIKLSEIWNLILVFLHLIIISVGLFASHITVFKNNIEENWINRTLIIIMVLTIVNLFVWISFKFQTQKFKEIIQKIFF